MSWRRLAVGVVACVGWLLPATDAGAWSVEEVPSPRAEGAWVTDTAEVIDADTETRLNRMLDELEHDLGVEVAVVTVDSVDAATPKDFATALFNHWGIGKSDGDSGLLVLMVMGERRLEMETGYGLEAVLSDGWLKSMQLQAMVPAFKKGDFAGGLEAGVSSCIERLRQDPASLDAPAPRPQPKPSAATSAKAPRRRSSSGDSYLFLVLLLCGVVLPGVGVGAWVYRKNRTCPHCKLRMAVLSEHEDDVHLDKGQQTEEKLGSVNYHFYYCTQCDHTKLIVSHKWLSSYSRCDACFYRTSRTSSRTIISATYSSSGLEEITERCAHCGHVSTHTRTIPKKVRSESSSSGSFGSSSSGGGSFGGGSSGGGGAGSSW